MLNKKYLLLATLITLAAYSFTKKIPSPPIGGSSSSSMSSNSSSSVTSFNLETFAATSSCAKVQWKNRGLAPLGFIKGMAKTFALSYCAPTSPTTLKLSKPLGSQTDDALKYYGLKPATPKDIFIETFTLGTGLAMRESSGSYCTGRDKSAGNTSSDTAEAGLMQTSFNSVNADKELKRLFDFYVKDGAPCYLETFKEGASCKPYDNVNFGAGDGLKFQKLSKSCPAFAAQYSMIVTRVLKSHFGPILRLEAQISTECRQMFKGLASELDKASCVF